MTDDTSIAHPTNRGAPALPDSAAMLRNAARLARLGYWVWDHETDRGQYASEELTAIHGLGQAAYLAELGDPERMLAWFHPNDRDAYRAIWFGKAKQGLAYEIEVRVLTSTGGVRHTREIGEPVFAEDGRLVRTVGTLQDVTEQRRHDEQLTEVLLHSPAVVYTSTLEPPYDATFISPNVTALTGHTPEQFLETPGFWAEHVHPDDRERIFTELANHSDESSHQSGYRFRCADGSYRWLYDRVRRRHDAAGRSRDAAGYIVDGTQRHRAERARQERVKELSCLYDVSEIRWNKHLTLPEILHAVAERLPGGFCHPELCRARITFEDTHFTSAEFAETPWRLSSSIRIDSRKIGQVDVFYIRTCEKADEGPFLEEERRLLDRIAGGLAETIEHRWTKVETEQRAAMLRDAASLANLAFYVWDDHARRVTAASDELPAILGLTPEACRRNISDSHGLLGLVHPNDRTIYRRFLEELQTAKEARQLDYRIHRPDGRIRHLREIVHPLDKDNEFASQRVCTVQDVTDSKDREALLREAQKMEALGKLTGGIAHDFNNLLTIIAGNLELLEGKIACTDQNTLLKEARETAGLGAQLTARLLAFGRRQPLEPRRVNLAEIVEGMRAMLGRTLGQSIKMESRIAEGVPDCIADPGQVENVILNLALNARDAMPDGGLLTVEVSEKNLDADFLAQHPGAEPGRYIRLAVTDTGMGMSLDAQERAFEPFFTTKESGAGTGLGLPTVHGFVKQSNGHIQLTSRCGHGTTVAIYLPCADAADPAAR